MRGQTMGQILDMVRAECGHSQNPAHNRNTDDQVITVLQRMQQRFWEDRDWVFLRKDFDIRLNTGQRYYSLPDELALERVEKVSFKWGDFWNDLTFGIGTNEYTMWDSDEGQRSWPVLKWDVAEDTYASASTPLPMEDDKAQIELWPVPSQPSEPAPSLSGVVRFTGIRRPRPFVRHADRADLDDQLLTLFTAHELLRRQGDNSADAKLVEAERHYRRIKARNSKSEMVTLGAKEKIRTFVIGPPQVPRL